MSVPAEISSHCEEIRINRGGKDSFRSIDCVPIVAKYQPQINQEEVFHGEDASNQSPATSENEPTNNRVGNGEPRQYIKQHTLFKPETIN